MEGYTDTFTINEAKMNAVLKKLRTTFKWKELMEEYESYLPKYDKRIVSNLVTEDIRDFQKIFYFKSNTVQGCRAELNKFLKDFWINFASENIEGVYAKMERYLDVFNTEYPNHKRLFINWIPDLGGILGPRKPDSEIAQRNYMRDKKIRYQLTDEVPKDDPYDPRYGSPGQQD